MKAVSLSPYEVIGKGTVATLMVTSTEHPYQERNGSEIAVTLVVPLRDEERSVQGLLDSIAAQTRPPDAVTFVDAGSLDRTAALLRKACDVHSTWTLAQPGASTPGRARNVGIDAADTLWIALTDAGIELDRHWLERLVRVAAAGEPVDVVWGHYEPASDGWFAECASLAYVAPAQGSRVGPRREPSVASCLLRREASGRGRWHLHSKAGRTRKPLSRGSRGGRVVAP
jgi:hypothetical protein